MEPSSGVNQILTTLMNQPTIKYKSLNVSLIGPPRVGKTTTRMRLLGKIANLVNPHEPAGVYVIPPTEEQIIMPVLLDHTQKHEEHQLFELGKTQDDLTPAKMPNPSPIPNGSSSEVKPSSVSTPVQPSLRALGIARETAQNQIVHSFSYVEKMMKEILEKNGFQDIHDIEDTVTLSIMDLGDHPEFSDVLSVVLGGPALHLVFFNAAHSLDNPVVEYWPPVQREESVFEHKTKCTTGQMLLQVLSTLHSLGKTVGNPSLPLGVNLPLFKPTAVLIGTHTDLIVSVDEVSRTLQKLFQQTDFWHDDFLCTPSHNQMFFPLDNVNGTEDILGLQQFIKKLISQRLTSSHMPTSWLLFLLALRHCYGKDGWCSMEQCVELAAQCNVRREDIRPMLHYIHHSFGTVLHFADVPDLSGIVFCQPSKLVEAIIHVLNPSFMGVGLHGMQRMHKSGEISRKLLEEIGHKAVVSSITIRQVISLLKHFGIVTEFPGTSVLFASHWLLPDQSIELANQDQVKGITPPPLLIQFEGGYIPTSVFSGIMVVLMSKHHWTCRKRDRYRNHISFISPYCSVELIVHYHFLEVRIFKIVEDQFPNSMSECCEEVRIRLEDATASTLTLYEHTKFTSFSFGFYCPCSVSEPHFCEFIQGRQMVCSKTGTVHSLGHSSVWFREQEKPGEESRGREHLTKLFNVIESLKKEHLYLTVKQVKLVLTGPPRVGKSTLKRRLMKEITNLRENPIVIASTGVEKPEVVQVSDPVSEQDDEVQVSMPKFERDDMAISQTGEWKELNIAEQISILFNIMTSSDRKPRQRARQPTIPVPDAKDDPRTKATMSSKIEAVDAFLPEVSQHSLLPQTSSTANSDLKSSQDQPSASPREVDSSMHLPGSSRKELVHAERVNELRKMVENLTQEIDWEKAREELHALIKEMAAVYVMDTGGQPEFHEVLPHLLEGPALHLVVFSLEKDKESSKDCLDKNFKVKYVPEDGKDVVPYISIYSVREVLFQLLAHFYSIHASHNAVQVSPEMTLEECISTPQALLIGTHKDVCFSQSSSSIDLDNVNRKLVDTFKDAEFFKSDFVCTIPSSVWPQGTQYVSSGRAIFLPVDNMDGTQNEMAQFRNFLARKIFSAAKEVELPCSVLLFHLFLRHTYEKDPGYCKVKECKKLAEVCRIPPDDVTKVLEYLHYTLGTILYYKDVITLSHLVFCNPNLLLNEINYIIAECFTCDQDNAEMTDRAKKTGIISSKLLDKIRTRRKLGNLSLDQVIDFLLHHKLVMEIRGEEGEELFMPCLMLPNPKITTISSDTLKTLKVTPLLIQFPGNVIPIGLFTSLVVQLCQMEWADGEPWKAPETIPRYRNQVSFSMDDSLLLVTLTARPNFIEVLVKESDTDYTIRPEDLSPFCSRVRVHVMNAIRETNLGDTPKVGFYCPKGLKLGKPHFAECKRVKVTCSQGIPKCSVQSPIPPEGTVWFKEKEEKSANPIHRSSESLPDTVKNSLSSRKTAERLPNEVFMCFLPQFVIQFSKCPGTVAYKLLRKKLITTFTWEQAQEASLSPQSRANTLVKDTQTALSSDKGDRNLRKLRDVLSNFPEMKRLSAKMMDKYERALSRDGELSSSSESESSESDSDSGKTAEMLPKEVFMHFLPRLAIAFSKCPETVAEKLFGKKLITKSNWKTAQVSSVSPQDRADTLVGDAQTALSSDKGDRNLRKLCNVISNFPEMKRLSAKIMDKYQRALSRDGEMSSSSESESSESDSDSGKNSFDGHMAKIPEEELDPLHLDLISKSLRSLSNWKDLIVKLDMDIEESLLECIKEDCRGDVNQCRKILLSWWLHSGRATKSSLLASCKELLTS